jgi:ParB family transcriptional regulator, chromosome partitioning protein
VLEMIDSGELREGHGRAILLCQDHSTRRSLARRAVREGWSMRRIEQAAREADGRRASPAREPRTLHPDQIAVASDIEAFLANALGRDTSVDALDSGYRVSIVVADLGDAERLLSDTRLAV